MAVNRTPVVPVPVLSRPVRRLIPVVVALALLVGLASPAEAQSLAWTKSPRPNTKVLCATTAWQTVATQAFSGTIGRNLVVTSFSMYSATYYTIADYRLVCVTGCATANEPSPPITLSIPYQTSNANPTNNGGISFIFTQTLANATYALQHRLYATGQAGKNFETADWTIAAVSLTMSGGTALSNDQKYFGVEGSNDGTSDITPSTVAFAAGSQGTVVTGLSRANNGTVTATVASTTGLANGDRVLISGVTGDSGNINSFSFANWNGFKTITVATGTTFTYAATGNAATATGNFRALLAASSLTNPSASTARMTLRGHGFAIGDEVLVNGATPSAYNGLVTVTSVGNPTANDFEYAITGSGLPAATGDITAIRTRRPVSAGNLTHPGAGGTGWARVVLSNHGYLTGDRVYVAGARGASSQAPAQPPYDSDLYNGYFPIVRIDANTFEYQMDGAPAVSPATGSILVGRTARALTNPGISQTGAVVTANLSDHGFNVGDRIVVGGTGEDRYNGDYEVTAADRVAGTITYSATSGGLTTTNGWARLGAVMVTSLSMPTANTVLVTTLAPHGLKVGDKVQISGVTSAPAQKDEFLYYQGDFVVASVVDAVSFRYAQPNKAGLATLSWALGQNELSARFIPFKLDDGSFLTRKSGSPSAAPVPLQVEVNVPLTSNITRDVVYGFYASLKQKTAGTLASAAQWRYANFQVFYQSPSMRATDSWSAVPSPGILIWNQAYQKTVDAVTPASGFTTPESGFVQLFQRFRATEGGLHRFRVKVEQRHGGDGLETPSGHLFAISTAWNGGTFRTLYATGRGYNKAANNTQWIDTDYQIPAAARFATESFTRTGTSSFFALGSSNTWATKGGGTALVDFTPGMRNANWASAQTGEDAWGSKLNAPNVVFMTRLYNGTVGDLCLDKGFLGGRMPFMPIGGCEAASQTAIGVASFAEGNPIESLPLMPPWEGSATSSMTGQQGAINADLVIFATESDVPTWSAVDSFRDASAGGPTTVSWKTSAELGTAAFRLERRDVEGGPWKAVGPAVLPAAPPSPAGATYQVEDTDAEPGREYEYRLVEEEANGNTVVYDAKKLKFENAKRSTGASGAGYVRTANGSTEEVAKRPDPSTAKLPRAQMSWKAFVQEDGIYSIPATPDSAIGTSRNHRMTNLGNEVAYANDGKGSRLLFFGKALNNLHTNRNAYILRPGGPRYMREINGKAPVAASQPSSFRATAKFEQDLFAGIALVYDASQDYWFWRTFFAENATYRSYEFPIDVPLVDVAGGTASITFRIHGYSDTPAVYDYRVRASLNGASVGEFRTGGAGPLSGTITFNASALRSGANILKLEALLDAGQTTSRFNLNNFEISYPKLFQAQNNEARVRVAASQRTVTVGGFTSSDLLVFDVTDPNSPAWIKAVGVQGNAKTGPFSAVFAVPSGSSDFVIVAEERVRTASVEELVDAGLKAGGAGAEHVVVAPYDLLEPAGELAAYRSGQGLSSMAVPIEAVWDEFGEGLPSPETLRSFFEYASANWSPAPKYAVLAGRGTYDERNLLGYNDTFVPTFFVATPRGLIGNDGPYEVDSDLVVGRVPATSAEAFRNYVAKLRRHESSSPRLAVTIGADNPDSGGDFHTAARLVGEGVPGNYQKREAYLGRAPLADVRRSLFEAFGRGDDVLGWVGHGGVDRLASEGALVSADVASLPASDRLPLMVGATCLVNAFHLSGIPSVGERLVTRADGGAVASWAPVGAVFNSASSVVTQTFLKLALDDNAAGKRLRDVVLETYEEIPQATYDAEGLLLFQLLGDPATYVPR